MLGARLGYGVQGIVFSARNQDGGLWALKAHDREEAYRRERDVYLRLKKKGVAAILGSQVPQLLDFDDALFVLAMTVVTRPYVLDFGGAFLDRAPEFSEEAMADWLEEKREQFGGRWPQAAAILRHLAGLGIHVVDVNANNISWPD